MESPSSSTGVRSSGLLGPNGAGKSSALLALAGLLEAERGEVTLAGEPSAPGATELRAQTGIVFQEPALDLRLTPRENLDLAAVLYGVPRRDRGDRVAGALEFAGLADRACEPVKRLSGGLRRRLELARALIHRPSLLLMDEPTSGLDKASYQGFWATLRRLGKERGVTVLLTTHRAEEAALCDRLAFLFGGRIVAEGTPDELAAGLRDVVALSVGDPEAAVTEIRAELGIDAAVHSGRVVLETGDGPQLVPRLAALFPEGRLESIEVRRPGLSHVFLKLTGHSLGADT